MTAIAPRQFAVATASVATLLGALAVLLQRAGSQFFADDYLYLQLARNNDLSVEWLTTDNYGHFAPLTRLAYFAIQRTFGLDYTLSALVPAALVVSLFLTLSWLFTELLGRRYLVLGLALVGATSVPLVRTMLWWGAGVHVLGGAAMVTLCVAAFVIWSRRGLERYRIVSVIALVAGLLVQERPLLTIGYLVLIRYLLLVGWRAGRPAIRMLRDEALVWLPYVAVTAVYLVYRIGYFPSSPQPGDPSQAAEFIALSTIRGWAPSLVGARMLPFSPLLGWAVVLGLAVFVVLAVTLVRRRVGGWRALIFLLLVYLANMGILAAGRFSVTDITALATDLQYYVDVHLATLMAFVLGFSVLPVRPERASRRASGPLAGYVIPVAVVALTVSTVVTARALVQGNGATVAHDYVNTARTGLRALPGPYALIPTKAPVSVAPSFIDPYTDVPEIFSLDRAVAAKLDSSAARRVVVLAGGDVVAAHGETLQSVPITANRVSVELGTLDLRDGSACLDGDVGALLKFELPAAVDGPGHFVALTYSSDQTERVQIATRGGVTVNNWMATELPAGTGVAVVERLEGTDIRKVSLGSVTGVEDLCVSAVEVGRIAAVVDGECQILSDYGEAIEPADVCDRRWPS